MSDQKKEQIIFMRKDVRKGIHAFAYKGKEVKIQDRELYPTDDKGLIKFLRADIELVEYTPESQDPEPVKGYKEMSDNEIITVAGARGINYKNLNRDEVILVLEKNDRENSAPENDPGEQNNED